MIVDDGTIRAIFGSVFGAVYGDGTLRKVTFTDDGTGSLSETVVDHPVKCHIDRATEDMRDQEAARYTGLAVKIFILQEGVAVVPDTDDRLLYRGKVWAISQVSEDPAASHWTARGVLHAVD